MKIGNVILAAILFSPIVSLANKVNCNITADILDAQSGAFSEITDSVQIDLSKNGKVRSEAGVFDIEYQTDLQLSGSQLKIKISSDLDGEHSVSTAIPEDNRQLFKIEFGTRVNFSGTMTCSKAE